MMHGDSRVMVVVCLATTSLPAPCLSTSLSQDPTKNLFYPRHRPALLPTAALWVEPSFLCGISPCLASSCSGAAARMLCRICHAREAGHQVVPWSPLLHRTPFPRPSLPLVPSGGGLGLPHQLVTIEAPFELGYERADTAQGAVAPSMGWSPAISTAWAVRRNWIRERCRPLGSKSTPALAANPRGAAGGPAGTRHRRPPLLRRYPGAGPDRSDAGSMPPPGRGVAAARQRQDSMPAASGEYHTMVTDGPGFAAPVHLGSLAGHRQDHLAYLAQEEP